MTRPISRKQAGEAISAKDLLQYIDEELDDIESLVEYLEAKGFKVKVPKGFYDRYDHT